MAKYFIEDSTLTGIADAIREKYGTSDSLAVSKYAEFIRGLRPPIMPEADTLDGCSWKNISDLAESGNAANYFSVGDRKKITLNGTVGTLTLSNYETYVYIIGFDHNGATNTIDFGTFKTAASGGIDICLVDSKYNGTSTDGTKYFNMNHWGNKNAGGWKGCDLRYDILGSTDTAPSGYGASPTTGRPGYDASATCATQPVSGTLMAALPSDLRAVMKPMTIYTDNIGGSSLGTDSVSASVDYLPLLAEFEIFGYRSMTNSEEQNHQAQYEYYSSGNSSVKYRNDATNTAATWWGRSPCSGQGGSMFGGVYTSGNGSSPQTRSSSGLAPIFRV